MQVYDFDVVHRAGATNANADSLSRTDFQVSGFFRIFNFLDSKAPTVGVRFLFSFEQVEFLYLQSLEQPMQGLMV